MNKLQISEISKRVAPLTHDAMGRLTGGFADIGTAGPAVDDNNGNCDYNETCKDNGACRKNETCTNNGSCHDQKNCTGNGSCGTL